ncbi:MAG: bifunctional 4-hydroxy-2-oxoglutarate aldolase/2-dehydro-3-deoxy-phosphogluconate aldolase [Chitinophagaceae bacterium]
MPDNQDLLLLLRSQGLLPLFFHPDAGVCAQVMRALYRGGIRAIEWTNRGPEALGNFQGLKNLRDREMPELLLGVGTIKNIREAAEFIQSGADFIISPGWVPGMGNLAREHGLVWIPGCMTPSEILTAEREGISLVKLFPGNLLGPGFVQAVREIFPKMNFLPTGGVDIQTASLEAWFHAGVCAVGMGTRLISTSILAREAYAELTDLTIQVLDQIKIIRNNCP